MLLNNKTVVLYGAGVARGTIIPAYYEKRRLVEFKGHRKAIFDLHCKSYL
jgi:hypothetical protein